LCVFQSRFTGIAEKSGSLSRTWKVNKRSKKLNYLAGNCHMHHWVRPPLCLKEWMAQTERTHRTASWSGIVERLSAPNQPEVVNKRSKFFLNYFGRYCRMYRVRSASFCLKMNGRSRTPQNGAGRRSKCQEELDLWKRRLLKESEFIFFRTGKRFNCRLFGTLRYATEEAATAIRSMNTWRFQKKTMILSTHWDRRDEWMLIERQSDSWPSGLFGERRVDDLGSLREGPVTLEVNKRSSSNLGVLGVFPHTFYPKQSAFRVIRNEGR
jgi:hypothetical protein